jgi:hypothetical protein
MKKTVLCPVIIIGGDPVSTDTRRMAQYHLDKNGYVPGQCYSLFGIFGDLALSHIDPLVPQLVLTVHNGEVDAFKVAKAVKGKNPGTRVVILSDVSNPVKIVGTQIDDTVVARRDIADLYHVVHVFLNGAPAPQPQPVLG